MVFIKFGNLCCFFSVFPPLPGTPIMYMLDCIFPHVIVLCLLFSFTSLYFILNKFCCQVFQYTSLLFLPCLICCPFPPEYFSIQILWFSCLGITLSFLYVQFLFLSWSIVARKASGGGVSKKLKNNWGPQKTTVDLLAHYSIITAIIQYTHLYYIWKTI